MNLLGLYYQFFCHIIVPRSFLLAAKCTRHGNFVTIFEAWRNSSFFVSFHLLSVLFFSDCLTWSTYFESLVTNFAVYWIARGLILVLYLMLEFIIVDWLKSFFYSVLILLQKIHATVRLFPWGIIRIFSGLPSIRLLEVSQKFNLLMYGHFLRPPLLLLLCRLATQVFGGSRFGLFFLEILSGWRADRRSFFSICSVRSCFFLLLWICIGCLFPRFVLIGHMRTWDLFLIPMTSQSLLIVFRWIFNFVFLAPSAYLVSFRYNCQLIFLSPMQFLLIFFCGFDYRRYETSSYFVFLRCPDLTSLLITLSRRLCRRYCMSLAFCFFDGCHGFGCFLISVSFIARFILEFFKSLSIFCLLLIGLLRLPYFQYFLLSE